MCGSRRVVHEPVLGALVADHGCTLLFERVDIGSRCVRVGRADDRERAFGCSRCGVQEVERVTLPLTAPVVGHTDHSVERRAPIEPSGADGLQRVHAPHAEADDTDGLDIQEIGGGHDVGELAIVVERRHGGHALLEPHVVAAGKGLDGGDGPAVLLREPGDEIVEQRPETGDVTYQDETSARSAAGWTADLGRRAARELLAHRVFLVVEERRCDQLRDVRVLDFATCFVE